MASTGMRGEGPHSAYREKVKAGEIRFDPAQQDAAEVLQRLHDDLRNYDPAASGGGLFSFFGSGKSKAAPLGVYLCGGVGQGKSMLMDLFFHCAPPERKRRVHFHAFMQEIHEAIKAWRDLPETDKRSKLRALGLSGRSGDDPIPPVAKGVADSALLLCFDELQVTDVADAMILSRLFEALFGFGVVVVATSNRRPRELYQGGINRELFLPFIDLITKRMDVHVLDAGTDYRLERLKGLPVYYTPLGPQARAQMDKAWAMVTDSAEGEEEVIEVKGRKVHVPHAAKGAARFTFNDLCAKPLGAGDYLAITERFHTIFIDDIPQMGPENRNEARRFVTLIDTLYEAHVNLVASAAAPPQGLYPAGDGAFEFERTASRLIEMQSADYMDS